MITKTEEIEENQEITDLESKKTREVVTPGEIVVSGDEYLAGEGTTKEGKNIIAAKFGLADVSGRLAKVIPLSGTYMARRGNVVIGKVTDVTFNGWIIDIKSPYQSFLPVSEYNKFINKNDLTDHFDIGDMIVTKVFSVKRKGVDLTVKGRNLGRVENGIIIEINPNKVPRVIGKEGSMINLIKNETNCDIVVGQNGIVWIGGNKVEDELFAKKAIGFVTEKSFVDGLTDKTKEWLEEEKKGKTDDKKEIKEDKKTKEKEE